MRRRTGALGILVALAATLPMAHTAHAQDLDCADFTYQEEAQALFNLDRSDPNRLDEDQGPDDNVACEALPRRDGSLTSSTSAPRPTATTTAPAPPATPLASTAVTAVAAPATIAPTRGVEGGLGGSSATGPSNWDTGIGLAFAAGALATTGYLVKRRRS
ncbi:excalibur calcium-binding protein [Streptomyces hirsutus]|uniref:Excalibur calcium-binding protein n=1 Tax=Streptomyces hirsutus TaxID=35620 RepID=A0ABZ1GGS4_9ACTN|nr:excalibur calcium-binding protein [Streptomyces hirsutus]WSD05304.1 excalibur calcium-binding protein [Streptomyces hirsutus]WTD21266.1 excalibur calcium-binding protein [Streptomyces hirsutus]WTD73784.1 excalibur calcium-binding protein [Streptomyces sp. NBC_01635]